MPRRSLNRRTGPRRKLVWARQQFGVGVATAILPAVNAPVRIDALDEFVTAYGASMIGATVVRIRGILGTSSDNATVNQTSATFTAYIGDANDVIRGPNANDNYYDSNSRGKDYFAVEPFIGPSNLPAQDGMLGSDVCARVIDVRAMRKLEEVSQRLIFDISAVGPNTVNQFSCFGDLSILLMLP